MKSILELRQEALASDENVEFYIYKKLEAAEKKIEKLNKKEKKFEQFLKKRIEHVPETMVEVYEDKVILDKFKKL